MRLSRYLDFTYEVKNAMHCLFWINGTYENYWGYINVRRNCQGRGIFSSSFQYKLKKVIFVQMEEQKVRVGHTWALLTWFLEHICKLNYKIFQSSRELKTNKMKNKSNAIAICIIILLAWKERIRKEKQISLDEK